MEHAFHREVVRQRLADRDEAGALGRRAADVLVLCLQVPGAGHVQGGGPRQELEVARGYDQEPPGAGEEGGVAARGERSAF